MEVLKNEQGLTEEEFLQTYNPNAFPSPSNTVDVLIFTIGDKETNNYRKTPDKELKILLIKRKDHPEIGKWALPGGFVDVDSEETLDDAAYRELEEETNIRRGQVYLEQLYTWGDPKRDPRKRIISISYLSLVSMENLNVVAGSDAVEAKWFSVSSHILEESRINTRNGYVFEQIIEVVMKNGEEVLTSKVKKTTIVEGKVSRTERKVIDKGNVGFDHTKIIQYGLERLKNKVEYTPIAFNLMPEYFTYNELHKVHQIILGKENVPEAPNFRRNLKKSNMIIETDLVREGAGHNPPKLIKFNPDYWLNEF